jgi:hypothetical protein
VSIDVRYGSDSLLKPVSFKRVQHDLRGRRLH